MMELLLQRLLIKYTGDIDNNIAMIYLEDAVDYCVEFTRQTREYVLGKLGSIIVTVALENLYKRGSEGLKGQSISGVSETYNDDVSLAVKSQLYKNRRI